MDVHLLWGFVAAAALAYVIPGPDWFLVLRHASHSRAAGACAALGVLTGLVLHTCAAALGISAVILASAELFTTVKLLGAAYLVFLGVQALRQAHRQWRSAGAEVPSPASRRADATALPTVWAQAFTANVLNPKAALFFVAVLPQFIDTGTTVSKQILLLGALDIAVGAVWWVVFVAAIAHFRHLLQRRRARIGLDAGAGLALCGLGGVLSATGRPQLA